ncbi:MAG: hypothetical protein JNK05_08720 [Myxococcales bacterium]|nr:hypothetical protein [Myxococcales bacterium]
MRLLRWCATMMTAGVLAACSEERPLGNFDSGVGNADNGSNTGDDTGTSGPDIVDPMGDGGGGEMDSGTGIRDTGVPPVVDGGGIYDDVGRTDAATGCGTDAGAARPTGCLGAEVQNNGLDDNCNGTVDEGSSCIPGSVQRCFLGPPGRRGVGACVDGMQTCQGSGEFGSWGPCMGGISPRGEVCDRLDNNCDGRADEDLCCNSVGTCPAPGDMRIPTGGPFRTYTVRGSQFVPGATRYRWRVVGGPCDQLLSATSMGATTYTLNGTMNTLTAEGENLQFRPTLSGDYQVTLTVTRSDGTTLECMFIIPIRAPGFRAELCWDRTGSTDIDFWVHRPNNTANWTTGTSLSNVTCGWTTCRNARNLDWGFTRTPGTDCREPLAGGGCNNPRLDIDNVVTVGVPENINIDNPRAGDDYRVAVNYFGGTGTVQPMVNIYCGGELRATYGGATVGGMRFGAAPIAGFNRSGGDSTGSLWRVVDVVMTSASACTLHPLRPMGAAPGPCVATNSDRTYNGNCSR